MTQYEHFGDAVTMDHVDANSEEMRGIEGDRDLLVIYDLATGCLGAYPVKTKSSVEVLQSLTHFAGEDHIMSIYTDRAPTLIAAVHGMPGPPIVHTTSIPGVPQTNGIAENRVKIMIRGIRVMLLSAGLPHCYWPYAAKYYAFMRTVVKKGSESIFAKRHKSEHFQGPLIPFGALIRAMPSAIQDGRRLKFEHTLQPAIFLGYIVQPGCRWYREFCYVFLDDIAGMSFYRKARWSKVRVTVHSGREVVFERAR